MNNSTYRPKLLFLLTFFVILSSCENNDGTEPEVLELTGVQSELFTRNQQPGLLRIAPTDSLLDLTLEFESEQNKGDLEVILVGELTGRAALTFLKYTPKNSDHGTDNIIVRAFDATNTLKYRTVVPVQLFGNAAFDCVNASFSDYATIKNTEMLTLSLSDNDSYCDDVETHSIIDPMHSGFDGGASGANIGAKRTSVRSNNTSTTLTLEPTAGSIGRVQFLRQHCVPVDNFDYSDIRSWNNERDITKNCKYYSVTLVTVDVTN